MGLNPKPKKNSESVQFTRVLVVVVLGGYPLFSISACSALMDADNDEVPCLSTTFFLLLPAYRGG